MAHRMSRSTSRPTIFLRPEPKERGTIGECQPQNRWKSWHLLERLQTKDKSGVLIFVVSVRISEKRLMMPTATGITPIIAQTKSGPDEAFAAAKTIQAPKAINPIEIEYETTVSMRRERPVPRIRSLAIEGAPSGRIPRFPRRRQIVRFRGDFQQAISWIFVSAGAEAFSRRF
jgi:hypothetical protein